MKLIYYRNALTNLTMHISYEKKDLIYKDYCILKECTIPVRNRALPVFMRNIYIQR